MYKISLRATQLVTGILLHAYSRSYSSQLSEHKQKLY